MFAGVWYIVQERRREIGIRVAIGAARGDVAYLRAGARRAAPRDGSRHWPLWSVGHDALPANAVVRSEHHRSGRPRNRVRGARRRGADRGGRPADAGNACGSHSRAEIGMTHRCFVAAVVAAACTIGVRRSQGQQQDTTRVWQHGSWRSVGQIAGESGTLDRPLSMALARNALYVFNAGPGTVVALGLDTVLWRYTPPDRCVQRRARRRPRPRRHGGVW